MIHPHFCPLPSRERVLLSQPRLEGMRGHGEPCPYGDDGGGFRCSLPALRRIQRPRRSVALRRRTQGSPPTDSTMGRAEGRSSSASIFVPPLPKGDTGGLVRG